MMVVIINKARKGDTFLVNDEELEDLFYWDFTSNPTENKLKAKLARSILEVKTLEQGWIRKMIDIEIHTSTNNNKEFYILLKKELEKTFNQVIFI